jgi:hypothetical protein
MEKNAAQRILIFVAGFYIIVALLAVCVLNLSGSIFAKRGEITLPGHFRALLDKEENETEEVLEAVNPSDKLQGLESLGRKAAEDTARETAGNSGEPVYEEPVIEEPVSEEPVSEETVSDDTVSDDTAEAEPEEHYYSFKTNNTETRLRMRREPGDDGKIIYELKPGSSGYVVELGDDWSKVSAYGHEGYCANEFLTMTEITKEEYEELKETSDAAGKKRSGTEETQEVDQAALNLALALAANTAAEASDQNNQNPAGNQPAAGQAAAPSDDD